MNSIKLRAQALLRNKRLMHFIKIVFPIAVIVLLFSRVKRNWRISRSKIAACDPFVVR